MAYVQMISLAALVSLGLSTSLTQTPLNSENHRSNFIQSSIFGKKWPTNEISEPLISAPTYEFKESTYTLYASLGTFAHLNHVDCTKSENDATFDIGIVGLPFDLGVSYRPGARFGPNGARQGSRRLTPNGGWSMDHDLNPFQNWATVVDCGDISNTPFNKDVAISELENGLKAMSDRNPKNVSVVDATRFISIGGDHTITLPVLRALHSTWGKVAVLHFDSHLDTWDPNILGGGIENYTDINHGTMLHIAHEEGLLSHHSNMHLGSRCKLFNEHFDLDNDLRCGFSYIRARQLDQLGVDQIVEKIVKTVGDHYVYLSVDIDVLDPAFAPATGTIESGGWSTRELLQIINGLSKAGLKIVGSDVVEFTPIYDNAAETTAIAVADIIYEILQWMVHVPVRKPEA